jgi:hypothetical protein
MISGKLIRVLKDSHENPMSMDYQWNTNKEFLKDLKEWNEIMKYYGTYKTLSFTDKLFLVGRTQVLAIEWKKA